MKKQLEGELMSLAHRILQLKNKADVHELKIVAGLLYEKLTVLSFTEKHFDGAQPTIGKKAVMKALEEKEASSSTEASKAAPRNPRPDGTEHNTEAITEPNTEKIKDIVASMDPETEKVDEVLGKILPEQEEKAKDDVRELGVHYDELPQFEPLKKAASEPTENPQKSSANDENGIQEDDTETEASGKTDAASATSEETSAKTKPSEEQHHLFNGMPEFEPKEQTKRNDVSGNKKSLNDRLKKGITIGLNDRLAYIKHLFDGNAADYNRVLSQLNTIDDYQDAVNFIEQQIKPDYKNWEGKEVYEQRFLQAIENKFD